jgi:hypothetical protein
MHSEPPQKLNAIERYGLFYSPVAVIFCDESYLTGGNIQNALVCNSHAVRVLAQVFYYMLCASQRRLAVYHPFGIISLPDSIVENRQFILFP